MSKERNKDEKSRVVRNHLGEIDTLADLVEVTANVYGQELVAVWQKTHDEEFRKTYFDLWNDVVVNAYEIKKERD